MIVCQINCICDRGSTGKLMNSLHNGLIASGHSSHILVPRLQKAQKKENVHVFSNYLCSKLSAIFRRVTGDLYGGAFLQTYALIRIIKKICPDIVQIHCINGNNINNYMLMKYLAKHHIKTVLTLHAEFPYTGGCAHACDCKKWVEGCHDCRDYAKLTDSLFFDRSKSCWHKRKKGYALFKKEDLKIISVSPWLLTRALQSHLINRFQNSVINNGINTTVFHPYSTEELRESFHIKKSTKIVLHVTAYFNPDDSEKGGRYVIELAKRLSELDYLFLIVANYGNAAVESDNVRFVGRIADQTLLAKYYSMADATLITSRRETFSMPTAESLCCGTPVVGFEAGGPESIADENLSKFVAYGDIEQLAKAVVSIVEKKADATACASKNQQIYSEQKMVDSYLTLYNNFFE